MAPPKQVIVTDATGCNPQKLKTGFYIAAYNLYVIKMAYDKSPIFNFVNHVYEQNYRTQSSSIFPVE
jgi:hypothetical protein